MTKLESTMYTLGQLVRAVWPKDDAPDALVATLLPQPASGLAQLRKSLPARLADPEQIDALVAKVPADLADPKGGVSVEDQGPFWSGYYHYLTALEQC